MSMDSQNGREALSLEELKQQLQALAGVEPPAGLRERLRARIPRSSGSAPREWSIRRWSRGAGWTGIAAAIVVATSVMVWLSTPSGRPMKPAADTNSGSGRLLAADYNGVLPPDTNTSDSNGLF